MGAPRQNASRVRVTVLGVALGLSALARPATVLGVDSPGVATTLFADVYYGIDSNTPANERRPAFLYNHTRIDAPQLNLGLVDVAARGPRLRANLGLMTGSYAEENLAQEPDWARHLFELNAGVALDVERGTWLDIGVLPSHLGFESAISSRNPTLTRSLAAENSPYFLTGARLTMPVDGNWTVAALVVTGWQRIVPVKGNTLPGFGTQVGYATPAGVVFNWSTFVGTDDPDRARRLRYFSNLYFQYPLLPGAQLTLGFDLGLQESTPHGDSHDVWWTPLAILRVELARGWAMAWRVEHFRDAEGVLVSTAGDRGLRTSGLSWNTDWRASDHLLLRVELRHLRDAAAVYPRGKDARSDAATSLLGSIALEF